MSRVLQVINFFALSMKSIGGTCTRESYDFGSSDGGHRGNYGAGGAVRPSPIRSVPMRGGTMKRTPFLQAADVKKRPSVQKASELQK